MPTASIISLAHDCHGKHRTECFFPPLDNYCIITGGEGGIAVKTNNLVGGMSDYFRYVSFVVQHFKHIFSDKQTKCRTQNNAGRATKENFIGSRLSLICRYILDHPI